MSPWAPEPPWHDLHSHHDVIAYYHRQYDECVRARTCTPFLYPFASLGALVAILYLLIPHQNRPWLRSARFLVWAFMAAFSLYTMVCTKARAMAPAFGVGLIASWGVVWVWTILVVHDAQTDFRRIERSSAVRKKGMDAKGQGYAEPDHLQDGFVDSKSIDNIANTGNGHCSETKSTERLPQEEYCWQSYPQHGFLQRLDWVLDIMSNFRGVDWNWRPASIPPPPLSIQAQLQPKSPSTDYKSHPSEPHTPHHHRRSRHPPTPLLTRRALLEQNLRLFLTGYLILDAVKTLMNHDPYFWGHISPSAPTPSYLPSFITTSTILLRIYRLALSQLGTQWALQTLFSLSPLFFCGLLGNRGEPWMYPPTWGPYSLVLDRGLAGWWGQWWHQTFRFAFDGPGRKLVAMLGWSPRGPKGSVVRLAVAFGLSGCLHAAGSFTAAGRTWPVREAMLFFLLQPVGMAAAAVVALLARWWCGTKRWPRALKRTLRWVYVHVWFYYTGSLLCNDFARGGVWLFEPLPVSLFRGLGLGPEGDGFWCWGRGSGEKGLVWWHSGERWWLSGFAF